MMRWLILVALVTSACGQGFFSSFMVNRVTFTNSPCKGTGGLDGTCFGKDECKQNGGIPDGACAQGHGVCCLIMRTCGESSCLQNTYFVNPNYPEGNAGAQMCKVEIFPLKEKKVHQLYIKFDNFRLLGPRSGDCQNDSLIVAGMNSGMYVPIICGSNDGQHMHLDIDEVSGPLRLTITTSKANFMRSWRMKIEQLNYRDDCYAPKKCLQYFREASGTIKTFNLQDNGEGQLLNKNKYGICFKTLPGFCDISLIERSFDISVSGRSGEECDENFLAVMGNKYCGQSLKNGVVKISSAGPMTMYLNTGDVNVQESKGVALDFMQLPCLP